MTAHMAIWLMTGDVMIFICCSHNLMFGINGDSGGDG